MKIYRGGVGTETPVPIW